MTTTVTLAATASAFVGRDLGHAGPGGWWLGPLVPLLWLALVALAVWLVARRRAPGAGDPLERAREVLSERYARGELSTEEYRERRAELRSGATR